MHSRRGIAVETQCTNKTPVVSIWNSAHTGIAHTGISHFAFRIPDRFTSSVWNFLPRIADVSPRVSHVVAGASERRLYSQATSIRERFGIGATRLYRIWKDAAAIEPTQNKPKKAVEPNQAAETKTEQSKPEKAVEPKQAAEQKQSKLASFCTRSWAMCTTCKEIWIFCWGCKKAISKMWKTSV